MRFISGGTLQGTYVLLPKSLLGVATDMVFIFIIMLKKILVVTMFMAAGYYSKPQNLNVFTTVHTRERKTQTSEIASYKCG